MRHGFDIQRICTHYETVFVSAEFTGELDKWDNHNAIARGWVDKTKAYHPVTFRKLYNKSSKREE